MLNSEALARSGLITPQTPTDLINGGDGPRILAAGSPWTVALPARGWAVYSVASADEISTSTRRPAGSGPTPAPTLEDYCPAGYDDYGTRYNWGVGKITIVSAHQECADRCTQYSAPQYAGGCKGYMTDMYYGMLFCRSYGGTARTQACASWARPRTPGSNPEISSATCTRARTRTTSAATAAATPLLWRRGSRDDMNRWSTPPQ